MSTQQLEAQLPADMKQELKEKNTDSESKIPYFAANYKPEGQTFDYSNLKAVNKVYYPDQQTVAITYEDGSVLTYRPPALKGWKRANNIPIMVTANNELIPSPDTLTLKSGDGQTINMNAPGFPTQYFPEYGLSEPAKAAPETPTNTMAPAAKATQSPAKPMPQKPLRTAAPAAPASGVTPQGYNPYGN